MSNLNLRYTQVPGSASEHLSTETPSSRRSWSKYLIGSVLMLFGLVIMSDFSVLKGIHQQTIVLHATGSETEIDSSSPSSSSETEDNQIIENEPIELESSVEKDEGKSNIRGEKKDKTKEKEKKNKDKDEKKEKEKKDKSKKELRPIETIALLGERNSGTTWMFDELTKCFGDDLIVSIF